MIDSMKRAVKQVEVLWLICNWLVSMKWQKLHQKTVLREVTREELMNVTHASVGVIRALQDRKNIGYL